MTKKKNGSKHIAESLKRIQAIRKMGRRKRYRRSALDEYCAELCKLSRCGQSLRAIKVWLEEEHEINVAHTTIHNYLKKFELDERDRHDHRPNAVNVDSSC